MNMEALLLQVDSLLSQKNDQRLRQILQQKDPGRIADLLDALPRGKRKVFLFLTPEIQAEVVLLLGEDTSTSVIPRLPDLTIARFLHFLDEDRATDVLQRLTPHHREHVLSFLKEDRKRRIEKLLVFDAKTAGGLMDLNFVEIDSGAHISAAVTAVQEYARAHKQVPVVLLHDKAGIRWLPPRLLLSAAGTATLSTIAKPVPFTLHSTDQKAVLDLMAEENTDIVCVVDEHQKVLGVIHLNDLLRVAEAEASEEAYRMAGIVPIEATYLGTNFATIWRKRVGWLSVLFIAELFTFTALASFESSIAAVTALALFVPLCISTGGNSGSQAATLVTRALAVGQLTPKEWWRVLRREIMMGLSLGVALGAVAFVRASLTPQNVLGGVDRWVLAFVIAQSVAAICLWGTLVGSMLPLVFKKLGFDPAYASSPFVATFVDVTGIVIYFSIAHLFLFA
jgi:magnesium transporter